MTDHLRNIALTVDEPDPGVFYWVLMESTEDASVFGELQASEESFDSYTTALRAGVTALERFAKDSRAGPRASGENEDAAPVNQAQGKGTAVPMANCGFSDLPDDNATD